MACEEYEGKFSTRALYSHERIKGTIKQARVEEIARRLEKDGVLIGTGPRQARRVAPAFFGRPEMVDTLYSGDLLPENLPEAVSGAPMQAQGRATQEESAAQSAILPEGHREAEKSPAASGLFLPTALPETPDIAPTEDMKLPDPFTKLFDDLDKDRNS